MTTELSGSNDPLFETLKRVQEASSPTNLANIKPEKWLMAAEWIHSGKTPTQLRKQGFDNRTIARIKREIAGDLDQIQAAKLEELRNIRDVADQVLGDQIEKQVDRTEPMEVKEMFYFNNTVDSIDRRIGRMEGRADVVIEHKKAKTPDELAKELEAMFLENTIEAEIVEDET